MSTELMVGAKGLFIAMIISIALVLISLVALILVSGCTANKSPDKWRDKMTFIWSFIWENHQNIFELSWLVASDTS
jgi:hypothetical protein